MPEPSVRLATAEDVSTILRLIKGLAAFENLSDQVKATETDLLRDGFGAQPRFECLIAEHAGKAVGFALFFYSYSTFEGRRGLYLEDLFVVEEARKLGAGRGLIRALARLALERDCARLELSVLDWNPARGFYQKLGFQHNEEWLPYRIKGQALENLASEA